MNEELVACHRDALLATVGRAGRLISMSKSLYREASPTNVPIFNANICLGQGKIWHGDLDLTLDELLLVELARRIGDTVYVLYEGDARFERENTPALDDAVYSVTQTGHSRFQHLWLERDRDGTLRKRPPVPDTRRRWRWRILWHRPRLLRFWHVEHQAGRESWHGDWLRTTLVYIGAHDRGATPLVVVGFHRLPRWREAWVELIWYPAHGEDERRNAPRALLELSPRVRVRRHRLWMRILIWPAFSYELYAGIRRCDWRDW